MCLRRITSRKPKKSGIGWKVFRVKSKNRLGNVYAGKLDSYEPGVTYKKNNHVMLCREPWGQDNLPKRKYSGFHIFATKTAAEERMTYWQNTFVGDLVVRKVRYYGATVIGREYNFSVADNERKVIIANRMKILPE